MLKTSGGSDIRLLLCDQNVVEKLVTVRKVLKEIIMRKCGGSTIKCDMDLEIFSKLIKVIVETKDT